MSQPPVWGLHVPAISWLVAGFHHTDEEVLRGSKTDRCDFDYARPVTQKSKIKVRTAPNRPTFARG